MKLPAYAVQIILVILFVVAAGTRFAATDERTSPYMKGASAMSYRHAMMVADGVPLDSPDRKANWPEGYVPSSYRPVGLEAAIGHSYRVARYFSETDGREFARRFVVLAFCLCVFTGYALTRRLWDCQAAGLVAAGFVAFFTPLIDATNGRALSHTAIAVALISFHLLALMRHRRTPSAVGLAASAVLAYAVTAVWELGFYYLAAIAAHCAFARTGSAGGDRAAVVAHALVSLLAAATLPWAQATRALGTWPVALAVASAASMFMPVRWSGTESRRAAFVAAATLVLTIGLTPLRAGASESFPAMGYVWARLRFLFAKPESPSMLADWMRHLWSVDHAPPSTHQLLIFFLPVAFLLAAAIAPVRDCLRERRRTVVTSVVLAAVVAAAFVVDRGAVVLATAGVVPFVALAGRGLSSSLATRGVLLGIAGIIVLTQFAFPLGAGNPTFQIARAGGFAHRDDARFLWVSLENTDRDLVGFVARGTSTADAILGREDVTALLTAFTGRTSVLLAGSTSGAVAQKHAELARLLYGDERAFYEECERRDVSWVLYSIDMMLDASRYSPRYLAGVNVPARESVAYRMHFRPDALERFTLVHENEHYRLFRVSAARETVFLTDHPPVYQEEVLARAGGDLDAFRGRLNELLLAYREAMQSRSAGNFDAALRRFNWCLQQAPRFTTARIAAAATLAEADRLDQARDAIFEVIKYAPDNERALYVAAYTLAALDETQNALDYLDVFFATARNPELISRARQLKTFVDQDIPITPEMLPE